MAVSGATLTLRMACFCNEHKLRHGRGISARKVGDCLCCVTYCPLSCTLQQPAGQSFAACQECGQPQIDEGELWYRQEQ